MEPTSAAQAWLIETSYIEDYGNGTDITGVAVLGTAIDNYPLMPPTLASTSTLTASPTASPSVPEFPMDNSNNVAGSNLFGCCAFVEA